LKRPAETPPPTLLRIFTHNPVRRRREIWSVPGTIAQNTPFVATIAPDLGEKSHWERFPDAPSPIDEFPLQRSNG
jgi:hypothetical protein